VKHKFDLEFILFVKRLGLMDNEITEQNDYMVYAIFYAKVEQYGKCHFFYHKMVVWDLPTPTLWAKQLAR
jgi:hypothetical protein